MTNPGADARAQLQSVLGGAYTVERELGRGGMATVWLAHDQKHKRPVAIKVLLPHLAASLGPERFRREIELAAGLQHPHILSVHDSGDADGLLWFSMPYVEGESLFARLARERQLPVADALRITREAAQALQYAHERGVVHRDIKPENLLLTRDGITLVADFGIAQALGAEGVAGGAGHRLTETGLVVGTPQYMSPEQATGERTLDARTDVYSLAAVLYEMLAGEPPFTGPNAQTVLVKMLSGQPPSVRRARPAVPEAVDAAISRALAPSAADRFASVADFARALTSADIAPHEAPSLTPLPPARAFRTPARLAVLAFGVLLGAGVLFVRRHGRSSAPSGHTALAVLPFENDGDTSNAYFADGITDEIRGKLTTLPALRVIARASSNQYRRTDKSPQQIARELGAIYLLTGTVRWETGPNNVRRVRVSPELVEVDEESAPRTVWQQSYDTTLADVFQVQAAVASEVAANLGVVLSPPGQAQLAQKPTQNLAAYDAYLRSTAVDGRDPPALRRALANAERAIALDSGFAAAWARVGSLHAVLYSNSTPTAADSEAARTASERAIALDSSGFEGYVARATYWNLVVADQLRSRADLEKALRLAPSSADVLGALGESDAAVGQWEVGVYHIRQATLLDPRSTFAANRLSHALLWLRRFPEARDAAARGLAAGADNLTLIEERAMSYAGEGDLAGARTSLRNVPATLDRAALVGYVANYWDLFWMLDRADRALVRTLPVTAFDGDRANRAIIYAQLYWLDGDIARARAYADSARSARDLQLRRYPMDFQRTLFRGLALAYLGRRDEARRDRERGHALAVTTANQLNFIPYADHLAARIDLALGDREAAITDLAALLRKPYFISPGWLRIDPTWDPLRGDPRFEKLARGAGR